MRTREARKRHFRVELLEDRIALSGGGFSALKGAAEVGGVKGGDAVLPANAKPHGYSLEDATKALAVFSVKQGANDPDFLHFLPPKTEFPFQVLYDVPSTRNFSSIEINGRNGTWFTNSNDFTVASGTPFFVTLASADDSPTIVGDFPKHASGAANYFFNSMELGATGFQIIVDGKSTPIGPSYVAFAETAPLPDGGGTHMIFLGAYLHPLSVGTHTVEIKGALAGKAILSATGGNFLAEDITYTVQVVPHGHL
jgi:hypothetical protein